MHGFITIKSELIIEVINHPYFQRLRRIRQLGLTDLVYPGALHTRFHHAIGAMHLMTVALDTLRGKGHDISDQEYEAAMLAILLHDIGHGPFSHALEFGILTSITHEEISLLLMEKLNDDFDGQLELAIKIYTNQYERGFFHQLVSSQLDVDRLDYLNRDYYFTGVAEGKVASDRILKMLELHNDEIVVEEKGIYSIESFLNSRRLMYWQVYLHKTVISAEFTLLRITQRVKELISKGEEVFMSPGLAPFFNAKVTKADFKQNADLLKHFCSIDDTDMIYCIKQWQHSEDIPLKMLCTAIINRSLFKVKVSSEDFTKKEIQEKKKKLKETFKVGEDAMDYLLIRGSLSNNAYIPRGKKINILKKNGKVIDISEAVDLPNIKALSKPVRKHFLCWPKEIN